MLFEFPAGSQVKQLGLVPELWALLQGLSALLQGLGWGLFMQGWPSLARHLCVCTKCTPWGSLILL